MRFVGEQLVLRLKEKISDDLLEQLNNDYQDILNGGSIVQSAVLDDEQSEPELAELPRLVLDFNRRSHGRLRQLINQINSSGT
jgi:hypothetical protein